MKILLIFICFTIINDCHAYPDDIFDELWTKTNKVITRDHQLEGHQQQEPVKNTLKIKEEPSNYGPINYEKFRIKNEPEEIEVKNKVKVKPFYGEEPGTQFKELKKANCSDSMGSDHEMTNESDEVYNDGYSSNEDSEELEDSDQEKIVLHSNKKPIKSENLCDEEKIKIVEKYIKIREHLDNEKGRKGITVDKIVNALGVTLQQIKDWKQKYGFCKPRNLLTDEERKKIIEKFDKMEKEQRMETGKSVEIKQAIAKELGTNLRSIYEWKKKFGKKGKNKSYTKEEKLEILKKYEKIKAENKNNSIASTYEAEQKIANELGVERSTIIRWRKAFGLSKWKVNTDDEKIKIINDYQQIEKENPQILKDDIAAKLNVTRRTINRWIREFENKGKGT